MKAPPVVSAEEWEAARQQLLVKEKELTRARDRLAAQRRRMPWQAVEKDYQFERPRCHLCVCVAGAAADIQRLKARMGWQMPWYTMLDDFDRDFGVGEWHGTNAFIRDGGRVFRTYFVNSRGDEALGSTWSYLDMSALGRQEQWEDSPEGYPQTPPYQWWHWHDDYGDTQHEEFLEQIRRSGATGGDAGPTD